MLIMGGGSCDETDVVCRDQSACESALRGDEYVWIRLVESNGFIGCAHAGVAGGAAHVTL